MEINEKLDIFYRATIEAAEGQSRELLKGQERIYREMLEAYEKKKQEEQQTKTNAAKAGVRREINRAASEQMTEIKKHFHAEQEKRREELFAVVEDKIRAFRGTEDYVRLLKDKIRAVQDFAGEEEFTVYLDPGDEPLRERLAQEAGCVLAVDAKPFGGGIRAVIPTKNVLFDESFSEKLKKEREVFSF